MSFDEFAQKLTGYGLVAAEVADAAHMISLYDCFPETFNPVTLQRGKRRAGDLPADETVVFHRCPATTKFVCRHENAEGEKAATSGR